MRSTMPMAPPNVKQLWTPLSVKTNNVDASQNSARQMSRQLSLAISQHPRSHIHGGDPDVYSLDNCYAAAKAHTHGPSWSSGSSYAFSEPGIENTESKDAYSWQTLSPESETTHMDFYQNNPQNNTDVEKVLSPSSPVKSLRHCDRVGSMPKMFNGQGHAPPVPLRSPARTELNPFRSKSQPQLFHAADTTKSLPPIPTNRSVTHSGNINIHPIVNMVEIRPDVCNNAGGKDFESQSVRSLTHSVRPSFLDKKASYAPSYTSRFSTDSESENNVPNAAFGPGALSQARDSVRSSIQNLAASSPFKVPGRTSHRPSAIRISSSALADPLIAVDGISQHKGVASTSWAADIQDNRSTYSSYYRPLKTPFPFPTLLPSPRVGAKRSRDNLTPTPTRSAFFPRRMRRLSDALQVFSKNSRKERAASASSVTSPSEVVSNEMPPPTSNVTAPQIRERILHAHERAVGGPDTPYYTDTEKISSPWRRHFPGLHLHGNGPSSKRRAKMWWKRVRGRDATGGTSSSGSDGDTGNGDHGSSAGVDSGNVVKEQKLQMGLDTDPGMEDTPRRGQHRRQLQVSGEMDLDDEGRSAAVIGEQRKDIVSWV